MTPAPALFDPTTDSELRGCDLVKIKIGTLEGGTRETNKVKARLLTAINALGEPHS